MKRSLLLAPRLLRVASVLVRYRLDDVIDATHLYRPLKWLRGLLPKARANIRNQSRGARLRLALNELGPIYVKAGQMMSTRRDLIPPDIADELAELQDRVPAFPGSEAQAIIEEELHAPIHELFAHFDETPLASASIAQVHAATLFDGSQVVIKVLRPGIGKRMHQDTDLLYALGELAQKWHPHADKVRPLDIVEELKKSLFHELDLQYEGANASLLRRNFAHSASLKIPAVHWHYSTSRILVLERVSGVTADDIDAIDAAGINRKQLAALGVRLFYEQVFRDNFFHADAHPGNIWVDTTSVEIPCFIALDFGIMGSLPANDQYWLAENFMALFERNYRRIAELHVAAGWIPRHIRMDDLEAAVRTVCEPYFTRPLSEISLAEVFGKLFNTARQYELTVQPQLLLLQKTLLNIEGIGRMLDPEIDIWAVAHPVLKRIMQERYSPKRMATLLRQRLPEWLHVAPTMPELLHELAANTVDGNTHIRFSSQGIDKLNSETRHIRRLLTGGILGSTCGICATLIWTLAPQYSTAWPIGLGLAGLAIFSTFWWQEK